MKLILFFGLAGSGKDTAGEVFAESSKIKTAHFALKMKQELAEILNIDVADLINQGPNKEKYRSVMIEYAEMVKKDKGESHWWNILIEELYQQEVEVCVILDARREIEVYNAYEMWKQDPDSVSIYIIDREGNEDSDFLTHRALAAVKAINYAEGGGFLKSIILNDKSKEEFKEKVKKIKKLEEAEELLKKKQKALEQRHEAKREKITETFEKERLFILKGGY